MTTNTQLPKKLVDLVVKSHYDGLAFRAIADVVQKAGFKTRLGTEYKENSIGPILRAAGIRKRAKRKVGKRRVKKAAALTAPRPKRDRLQAVKAVLSLHMDPSERIALAMMIID